MKQKIILSIAIVFCTSAIVTSCKRDGPDCIMIPPPPSLTISGIVTDDTDIPLESIEVVVDSVIFEDNNTRIWQNSHITYTDKEGIFSIVLEPAFYLTDMQLLSEATITAHDTTKTYYSQTHTYSIHLERNFKDIPQYNNYTYGYVNAEFVLQHHR